MSDLFMAFPAIGTNWSITVADEVTDAQRDRLVSDIAEVIDAFDVSFSRFRKDSWVTKLAGHMGTYALPEYGYELLAFYERLYRASGGLVSPLIGQVMTDAGYDADYTLVSKMLTVPPTWDDNIRYDSTHITLTEPALLDFGAAGKGLLVDIVGALMERSGCRTYVVNAGGDILQRGASEAPVFVGLEDPADPSKVIGTIAVHNQSVCASAGSRRQWGKYHHIINPRTLESPKDILATWVVADDTMTADGLATALFFMPAAKLRQDFTFKYVVMRSDRSVEYSKELPVQF